MKKLLTLLLLAFTLQSCAVINNNNFTDRRFKRILIKNIWLDAGQGFGYFYNYERYKEQGGYGGYQYSIIKFNKNGTFDHQRTFGGKRGELDSLGIFKYEDTHWDVKNKQLYIKAKITYRGFSSKDSTILEEISMQKNVYDINIRKSESIKNIEIDFPEVEKRREWNRIQDYKAIRHMKK